MNGTRKRKSRTVRELGGEISAELNYAFVHPEEKIPWQLVEAAVDIIMRTLARRVGTTITMDEDFPVEPLPHRFPPEDEDEPADR
jgi:hypothetical protein